MPCMGKRASASPAAKAGADLALTRTLSVPTGRTAREMEEAVGTAINRLEARWAKAEERLQQLEAAGLEGSIPAQLDAHHEHPTDDA